MSLRSTASASTPLGVSFPPTSLAPHTQDPPIRHHLNAQLADTDCGVTLNRMPLSPRSCSVSRLPMVYRPTPGLANSMSRSRVSRSVVASSQTVAPRRGSITRCARAIRATSSSNRAVRTTDQRWLGIDWVLTGKMIRRGLGLPF